MSCYKASFCNKFYFFYNCQDPETESTEEDVEPKLKYVRISNDLEGILSKDAVSIDFAIYFQIT